jgi:Holliday junction resolvase
MEQRTIEQDCFGESTARKSINSKVKGSTNERACAKSLQQWTGYKFVRVPGSGSLRWRDSTNVAADLICDEPGIDFQYTIETKHLAKITIKLTLSSASHIFKMYNQVMADARRAAKVPIALLRSNGMDKGEYYLILEASLGGTLMAMAVPPLFSGSNHTHSLIGFLFSDVKRLCPFHKWDNAVRASNIIKHPKITT